MSHSIYPSWRYNRNGKAYLCPDPDHEPQGPNWDDKPWPPELPKVELKPCCLDLKAKFDAAWEKRQKEHAAECALLQAELQQLKSRPAAVESPVEAPPKPKKK